MKSIADIKIHAEVRMKKTIEKLKDDFHKLRTGRANTGILDHILVEYYGNPTPITQVATMSLADNNTILINVWEKEMVTTIDKAIRSSDLGLNPITAGNAVRVPMPPLTEERRRELAKVVKHEAELCRVAIRNARRDAIHELKEGIKNKTVSEDEEKRGENDIQKLTDHNTQIIDKMAVDKEKELLSV